MNRIARRWIAALAILLLGACDRPPMADLFSENDPLETAIGLLPAIDSPYGGGDPARLEEQIGRPLNEADRALYARDAGGTWRVWSDDRIRFEIPDDPRLVVTPVSPGEAALLRVVGSVMGTTDHRFERAYRITVGDELPYGLVLVSENDWFDEGICLCGPVVWQAFLASDGNLLEFSLLPDGAIKKVQAINGRHRAILFEWTHSVLTREAYARLATSLRLVEASPRSREEWHRLTVERRGDTAGFGWLRAGMDRSQIEALLGEPDRVEKAGLVYRQEERSPDGSGWFEERKLALAGGRLSRFDEGWLKEDELPPLEGSVAWAIEVAERSGRDGPKPSREEIDRVFAEFVSQGPRATEQWNSWCQAIHTLHEEGHASEDVLPLVEARFLEPGLNGHYAAHLLSDYGSAKLKDLVPKRIEFLLGDQAGPGQRGSELSNLFTFLGEDVGLADWIRKGIEHGDAEVRRAAAWKVHRLPEGEASGAVRVLLADSDHWVRNAAISRAKRVCVPEDLPWLEQARDKETEERIREEIDEAIAALRSGR
jgi:hypothetical protein